MSKITIFLAEDNELDQIAVEREFKPHEATCFLKSFANGKKIIDELKSGELPDCILLDMDMPEVDGFEVLKYLKSQNSVSIPVFVMVSSELHQELLEKIGCQPTGFLAKPVRYVEVLKALES